MGINSNHWYVDDSTDLWQVGIQGYGQPLDAIVDALPIPMNEPKLQGDPLHWVTTGVLPVGDRYGFVRMTYGNKLQIETVGYGHLAFQALFHIDKAIGLLSLPMDDTFREQLHDEHYHRKHNFIFYSTAEGIDKALEDFEQPLQNMITSIHTQKKERAQQERDQKIQAYVRRQLAYSK